MSRVTKKWRPGKRVMLFSDHEACWRPQDVVFGMAYQAILGHRPPVVLRAPFSSLNRAQKSSLRDWILAKAPKGWTLKSAYARLLEKMPKDRLCVSWQELCEQGWEDELMNHIGEHFGLAWATITGHIEAAEALAGRGRIDSRVLNAVNALVESGVENAMLSPVRRQGLGLFYQFAEDIKAGRAVVALERESFYVDRRCA